MHCLVSAQTVFTKCACIRAVSDGRSTTPRYNAVKEMFKDGMEGDDPSGYKGMLQALQLECDKNVACPAFIEDLANVQAAAEEDSGVVHAGHQRAQIGPLPDVERSAETDGGELGVSVHDACV